MSEPPTTLEELRSRRSERDRPTHVHVVGDFGFEQPRGRDVAERVAEVLVDGGTVREDSFNELDDGDVALVTIEPGRSGDVYEANDELYQLASTSRVKMLGGIVVLAEQVTSNVERTLHARVWAESGAVDSVGHLQIDPYDGYEVVERKIGGIADGE